VRERNHRATLSTLTVVLALALAGRGLAADAVDTLAAGADARAAVEAAVQKAKAGHKTTLVVFGASWCGFCKRFDRFLQSAEVGPLMQDHFEVVHLVVQERNGAPETPGGEELLASLGGARSGLPFFAFLDDQGKKIGDSLAMPGKENLGHPVSPAEIRAFAEVLRQVAPRMTGEERQRIADYLTAMSAKKKAS
jgi:thioredoxin-related protein